MEKNQSLSTGREPQPRPIGEEHGTLVYHYKPNSQGNFFSRSSSGGCPTEDILQVVEDKTLIFESRFESGNLEKAIKITDTYYELHLRNDLYTSRHCQWFYFQIKNMKTDVKYRFSIVNFTKPDSLYTCGMKPVLYSKIEADRHFVSWTRVGDLIRYYRNDSMNDDEEDPNTYTLTFTLSFPHEKDTVYLAHCFPYRYSDVLEDLLNIQNDELRSVVCDQKVLCKTLAGNPVHLLTVTNPASEEEIKTRHIVVLTGRVHPGESPSSWIMRGAIEYITGSSKTAYELRERFVFKIVPMLNPDGVIVGNTRCNMTGRDLNRQYKNVMKEAFPPVYHVKMLIKKLLEEGTVAMYCDFHAHSRKFNIFMYGCENRRHSEKYLREQIFPLMLHKNAANKFSFEDCKFTVQRSKESTGRVVFWNMGITNSFTLEASYGGSNMGSRAFTHFSTGDYQQLGKSFCETILDFCDTSPPREQLRHKIIQRLNREESTAVEPANISLSEYSSLSSSGGSEDEAGVEDWSKDSISAIRANIRKSQRRKKRRFVAGDSFYTTNYSEYLRPENYSSGKDGTGGVKRSNSDRQVSESTRPRGILRRQVTSPAQTLYNDFNEGVEKSDSLLADAMKGIGLDSESSTDLEIDSDPDLINLSFQPVSEDSMEDESNSTDGALETCNIEPQDSYYAEFSALSCQKGYSEILASVKRIKSSLLRRRSFIQNPQSNSSQLSNQTNPGSNIDESDTAAKPVITVEETRVETRVEILRTPASPKKVKTTRKKWKKTISSTTLVDEAKKPKKVAGSEKKSTKTRKKDEKKKETALTKVYKRAGTLTKLEVFINPETRRKNRRKSCDEKIL